MILLATVSCAKNDYRITGSLDAWKQHGYTVDSIVVQTDVKTVARATLTEDSFVVAGECDEPRVAELTVYVSGNRGPEHGSMLFILEKGNITMLLQQGYACEGTPLNDAMVAFDKKLVAATTVTQASGIVDEMLAQHGKDPAGVVALLDVMGNPSLNRDIQTELVTQRGLDFLALLSPEMRQTSYVQEMEKMLRMYQESMAVKGKSGEGMPFVDFEAEYNGKTQHLSDYVGKGKYVLVDFWASWCGPCRMEIPNLIAVYNKYKGEKFNVLGVATWDKPRDTQKAIDDLHIPYPQIMNAQQAGSEAYGIEGIPEIILFGPDGTILKRGLRGNMIEDAVKDALKL